MRFARAIGLGLALIAASGVASASTIITPSRGPTGSPPYTASLTLEVGDTGTMVDDFTVQPGDTVLDISVVLPYQDAQQGVVCGVSNAYLDGGTYNPLLGGFAATISGTGTSETATCSYSAFTGDPDGSETVLQMELDCAATNIGIISDPGSCAGVPYDPTGKGQGDVDFSISGAVPDVDLGANSVIASTPEPQSLALLLIGLSAIGVLAWRRRQLA